MWHYEEISELLKSLNADKRESLEVLERWLTAQGVSKAQLDGRDKTRTVGMVSTKRYKVDHKQLNALLDPEQRAEIVTESRSEYLRVSYSRPSPGCTIAAAFLTGDAASSRS